MSYIHLSSGAGAPYSQGCGTWHPTNPSRVSNAEKTAVSVRPRSFFIIHFVCSTSRDESLAGSRLFVVVAGGRSIHHGLRLADGRPLLRNNGRVGVLGFFGFPLVAFVTLSGFDRMAGVESQHDDQRCQEGIQSLNESSFHQAQYGLGCKITHYEANSQQIYGKLTVFTL